MESRQVEVASDDLRGARCIREVGCRSRSTRVKSCEPVGREITREHRLLAREWRVTKKTTSNQSLCEWQQLYFICDSIQFPCVPGSCAECFCVCWISKFVVPSHEDTSGLSPCPVRKIRCQHTIKCDLLKKTSCGLDHLGDSTTESKWILWTPQPFLCVCLAVCVGFSSLPEGRRESMRLWLQRKWAMRKCGNERCVYVIEVWSWIISLIYYYVCLLMSLLTK